MPGIQERCKLTVDETEPFYVKERSDHSARPKPVGHEDLNSNWVGAGHLKIGSKIKQADGTTGVVANVTSIQQTQEMFNLTVSEAHTFYVGTNGWLVHNAKCPIFSNGYQFKVGIDVDLRGTGATWRDAVAKAFENTGIPKDQFQITKWAKDLNGKSWPVEWRAKGGAEVSIDFPHGDFGPPVPHVGWQTPGKGNTVGHIMVDNVPFGRSKVK